MPRFGKAGAPAGIPALPSAVPPRAGWRGFWRKDAGRSIAWSLLLTPSLAGLRLRGLSANAPESYPSDLAAEVAIRPALVDAGSGAGKSRDPGASCSWRSSQGRKAIGMGSTAAAPVLVKARK